jgi:hypothetical protein
MEGNGIDVLKGHGKGKHIIHFQNENKHNFNGESKVVKKRKHFF